MKRICRIVKLWCDCKVGAVIYAFSNALRVGRGLVPECHRHGFDAGRSEWMI